MGKEELEREAESWVAKIRQRYPRVSALVWIYVIAQTAIQGWTYVIRPTIDAASELQFVVDNWRAIGPAVVTGAKMIVSPLAGIVTSLLGIGYLILDRRVARLSPGLLDTDQAAPIVPDTAAVSHESSTGQSKDVTDYQLEQSNADFRAVFQDLPNESFHVVNPERDHFSHVAWVVGFTNRWQVHCIVRARLTFRVRWGAKSPYILRTVVNGAWLEGTGAEVELADKETRYLILAVAKINKPADWLSAEDHRLTVHHKLGIEFRPLPLTSVTVEVTTVLYGGEIKIFTFGANLKTLRALTDLTPAK